MSLRKLDLCNTKSGSGAQPARECKSRVSLKRLDLNDIDSKQISQSIKKSEVSVRGSTIDETESESSSQSEKKFVRRASHQELGDVPAESDYVKTGNRTRGGDCEDSAWKMRVQLTMRNEIKSKPKKAKLSTYLLLH